MCPAFVNDESLRLWVEWMENGFCLHLIGFSRSLDCEISVCPLYLPAYVEREREAGQAFSSIHGLP
jgi:hypothetical protein